MEFLVISCVLLTLAGSVTHSETSPLSSTTSGLSTSTALRTTTLSSLPETSGLPTISTRRCCAGAAPRRPKSLIRMSMRLEVVPEGYPEAQILNVAYNNIGELPGFVFWNNSYSNLKKIFLQQNRIANVSVNAFKGLKQVRQVDLSDNLISSIDPYTFKANSRMQKLILMNNLISFDRLQTFVLSHSIEHLVLSNNRIDQIYELTFLGVPNLRNLVLNNNDVFGIAPNSFRTLSKLNYLSLANTGVYRLGESMFSHIPRIINLQGTPLSARFEPPLTIVKGQSVVRLVSLTRVMIDENYFTAE